MKYAVLGTGMVGHTLATKLVSLGHDVIMGARTKDNEKAAAWAIENGDRASNAAFQTAAASADRVIFAVNGANIGAVADMVGKEATRGKLVIDVSNPLDMSHCMPPTLIPELSNTTSAAEELQKRLPDAKVVKTLNTMNHQIMVNPDRISGEHDVFLCGDDTAAKAETVSMLNEFGWQSPTDLGPLAAARGLEGMMPFWLRMWSVVGSADFNYRIVRN
ncbi:MAG: NAD(P)-binding domain-containing protein [Pseudomonadota bacterium]